MGIDFKENGCLKLGFVLQNYGHALILQKTLKNIVKLPMFHYLQFTIQSEAQYFNSPIFIIKKKIKQVETFIKDIIK